MHHKAIKKIADQLKEIASQVSAPDLGDGESFQMHHGVFYQLPNDAVIAFKELVAQILRNDDFHKRFSEKYVEEKLKEVFAGLLKDSAIDLESALMALVGEMDEYEKKCIVLLSVEGVRLSVCTILGKVKLAPCDESLFSFMQEKAQFVMESSIHGEGVKSVFRERLQALVDREFTGGCVAIFEINAEPIRAYEEAKQEVRRVVDVLRYSSKFIYPLAEDVRVGLKGDNPRSGRSGLIFSEDSINTKSDSVGSRRPFEINEASLVQMNEFGVFRIFDALNKKQASNLEEALIRSVHWYSVALTQDDISNRFLFLIIALEALLLVKGGSIGGGVAESVAFLVSDTLSDRKKIVSRMKDYYGKRSAVAHGGSKLITDAEFYTLLVICGSVIMKVIEMLDSCSSQNDLMDWIQDKRLS